MTFFVISEARSYRSKEKKHRTKPQIQTLNYAIFIATGNALPLIFFNRQHYKTIVSCDTGVHFLSTVASRGFYHVHCSLPWLLSCATQTKYYTAHSHLSTNKDQNLQYFAVNTHNMNPNSLTVIRPKKGTVCTATHKAWKYPFPQLIHDN